MNQKIIAATSMGLTLVFTIGYVLSLEAEVLCDSDIEPPTGNSVWNDEDCIWEMQIGMDLGEGYPSEMEISNAVNQKIAQKLVNYTVKLYSQTNSVDNLEHITIYKFGDKLVRYVWVVDLETGDIVVDPQNNMVGQQSTILQNSLDLKDKFLVELKDTNQTRITSTSDGQTITSWIQLYDGLIFGSSFIEKLS